MEGREQPLLWDGERKALGVIVRENQHHPVADGKWEHHLTVAVWVTDRVMHDRTVHRPCFPGREADGVDFSSFSLQFPFIFHNFPTCCVLSLGPVVPQTGIPWELRAS